MRIKELSLFIIYANQQLKQIHNVLEKNKSD